MRLSEAIRLGAMLRPQGFHDFIQDLGAGIVVSCALGAAAEAIGSSAVAVFGPFADTDDLVGELDAAFGTLLNTKRRGCPSKGCGVRRVTANVIAHLNDDHRWTREQIADWVESIEPVDVVPEDVRSTDLVGARSSSP
jgi:hypothetical protein